MPHHSVELLLAEPGICLILTGRCNCIVYGECAAPDEPSRRGEIPPWCTRATWMSSRRLWHAGTAMRVVFVAVVALMLVGAPASTMNREADPL